FGLVGFVLFIFLSCHPALGSRLLPYTTLFRARRPHLPAQGEHRAALPGSLPQVPGRIRDRGSLPAHRGRPGRRAGSDPRSRIRRSEEHTSELQSRENLVCRLLLEKRKKKYLTE